MTVDIHKAAGIFIDDRKVLVVRARDSDTFISVGGKLEAEETSLEALKRECQEELSVDINLDTVSELDTYHGTALGKHAGKSLRIDAFLVDGYRGNIERSSEIVELAWINSTNYNEYKLAPIFERDILPALLSKGLID